MLISNGLTQDQHNWPHWRGPNHNGISAEKNLPTSWSISKNIVWKTELPWWGAATPIIWGDKIFIVSPSAADSGSRSGSTALWPRSDQRAVSAPATTPVRIALRPG